MDKLSEYSSLLSSRETMYRFLGRFYRVEVNQDLLKQMQGMSFPAESSDAELNQGYRMLEGYLQKLGRDPVTDLAVDYAKVFLGAGMVNAYAAYPYESVYTSPERLVMQDARDEVVALYRAKGLDIVNASIFPEDHITLELEFMSHLCLEARGALHAQNLAAAAKSLQEQRAFLAHHLSNWVPDFCTDVEKHAETDFYKAIAKITAGYLHLELSLLENLIAEIDTEILCGV
ncbi:anaerobic sulfite reductase subunit A [Desulfitobacterium sp. LBE]|uniref:Cytoplasmic chaperone TorD n=2 Tax=Desulfitobacterium hafniense TaxID=49338 RepID=A0A098B7W9_DESHA|nr:molecular chaperone TorD family protein [Desulfitobacterium sp. LBE]TWH57941.1 anaerobic sulfite reductase subunit A [Desulfitobacterium sp. LBE]CDX04467.1 Cytoplasmic chaperone TorD [Desulfitobacterium hafniense]